MSFVLKLVPSHRFELLGIKTPRRYAGRMFKVAQSAAGTSEPPPLPPTTVVADFKRRRKETEAERFAFGTFGYYCTMLLGV